MNIFVASLAVMLPKRYRQAWLQGSEPPAAAAIASGVVELFLSMDILIHRYFIFANQWLGSVPGEVVNGGLQASGETGLMGLGTFVLFGYALQPLTIILLYFALEGATRAAAPVFSGEIVGSFPFFMIAFLQEKLEVWREEARLGPRIADHVETASESDDVRIASCRPKPEWDDRVTISYRQMLYEVAGQEAGTKPRPFVYLLRKKPEYKTIRALRYYHPDEVRKVRR